MAVERYVTPTESLDWLRARLRKCGLTLDTFAEETGINKGNLWRYFTHQQRLLIELGVMPKR
jgi:hypothetical protein